MTKTPEEIAAEQAAAVQAAAQAAADKLIADKATFLTEFGFPQDTAVADMAPLEQAAYWRTESKKQQKKNEGVDVQKLQADAAELATLKAEKLPEQERLLNEAREEARREGEVIGAEKYLKPAVVGKFQALTGRTDEEVATTFEYVDPKSFLDDKGEIDDEKLKAFAATFGLKDSGGKRDPVAEALARQQQAGGGSGSSIADKRKETRERMNPTTKA